jgi:alpha-galactosidase
LGVEDATLLHRLFPGKTMSDGLRVLMDDNACLQMSDATVE